MDKKQTVAILGAGAVGSVLGGMMARTGKKVILIAKKEHVRAIQSNGLSLTSPSNSERISIEAEERLTYKPGAAVISVKSQDLVSICRTNRQWINQIPTLLLQNGVQGHTLAASVLDEHYLVSAVVLFHALYESPGHVFTGNRHTLVMGNPFSFGQPALSFFKTLLEDVLKVQISPDIRGAQWTKLLINISANSVSSLTGKSIEECFEHPAGRRITALLFKEALGVINSARIKLSPLPGKTTAGIQWIGCMPPVMCGHFLRRWVAPSRHVHRIPSTLQSLLRGRPSEVDFINGEIIQLGRSIGVPTPLNSGARREIVNLGRRLDFFSFTDLEKMFAIRHA